MRREAAYNIVWVFHVDIQDVPEESWNRFENYYPGDHYIDWLGVSNYGASYPMDDEWYSFAEGMENNNFYNRLLKMAPNKPIIIAEFAVPDNHPLGSQEAWAEAALRNILEGDWPAVIGFSWWSENWPNDDNPEHDTYMGIPDNPALGKVFRRLVGENKKVRSEPEYIFRNIGK